MSLYNILKFTYVCPRQFHECEAEAEFKYGLLDFHVYHIGDVVAFGTVGEVVGDPGEAGFVEVEGYAECQCCHKDYWIVIHIENRRIIGVSVDENKQPLVPDDLRSADGRQLKWIEGVGWA